MNAYLKLVGKSENTHEIPVLALMSTHSFKSNGPLRALSPRNTSAEQTI